MVPNLTRDKCPSDDTLQLDMTMSALDIRKRIQAMHQIAETSKSSPLSNFIKRVAPLHPLFHLDNLFSLFKNQDMVYKEDKQVKAAIGQVAIYCGIQYGVPPEMTKRLFNTMETNCFSSGLYRETSYLNHSCDHNAMIAAKEMMAFDHSTGKIHEMKQRCPLHKGKCNWKDSMHIITTRRVRKGEALTINYMFVKEGDISSVPLCQHYPDVVERRAVICKNFGFTCQCSKCK